MFEKQQINYIIYVNNSNIPVIPENVKLVSYKGEIELNVEEPQEDLHKGEILVACGSDSDLEHWLSGVTLYMANDATGTVWSKITMPLRRKH